MKKLVLVLFVTVLCFSVTGQTAVENYSLVQSDTFNLRTEMLLIKSCNAIVGEDTTTYSLAIVNKRHSLAMNVYSDIAKYRMRFVRAIAAQGTLTESSSDNDIEFTINSVFNDLAGVKFDD